MEQPTFSDLEYQDKKRKARRKLFLERVDGLIPSQRLEGRIQPFYPKAGRGRLPPTRCLSCCESTGSSSEPP